MIEVNKISGIGEYCEKQEKERKLYLTPENDKAFLVVNKNTFEMRCDRELSKLLQAQYESVMESRYFGRGGIEIVNSGQLPDNEIEDLIRLSYNLSVELEA